MNGYTKLFGSIVASTIWREDDKTRIVWVTMLAMANKHGDVEASIPGLSDLARVSIADVEKALATLLAPDGYSRTKDYEGRRISPIEGGWHILNHSKYREKMSKDERRNYLARKQAERRARLKAESDRVNTESTNVAIGQHASTPVNIQRDIAEADTEAEERERALSPVSETLPRGCGRRKPPGWPGTEAQAREMAERGGVSADLAGTFWRHYDGMGYWPQGNFVSAMKAKQGFRNQDQADKLAVDGARATRQEQRPRPTMQL